MSLSNRQHSLKRTLFFLSMVGGCCFVFSWLDVHWSVGGVTIVSFPQQTSGTAAAVVVSPEEVQSLLNAYDHVTLVDTALADTLELPINEPVLAEWIKAKNKDGQTLSGSPLPAAMRNGAASRRAAETWIPTSIHENLLFKGDSIAFERLWRFYGAAQDAFRMESHAMHVLHFGDSQIEGDRITSELRHAFQTRWGGSGPGFISAVPQAQMPAFKQRAEGWERHTSFGRKDTTLGHDQFGLLATLGRWIPNDSVRWTSPISFEKRNMGHALNRDWASLHILSRPFESDSMLVQISCDSTTYVASIQSDSISGSMFIDLPSTTNKLQIQFEAPGPDINAIGLYSNAGIVVHNIPMRGSSGTIFRKANRVHWARQIQSLNPGLILLQYGGNTVPYVDDAEDANRYARWLGSQIQLFQSTLPETPIVLIGPSDMSTKEGLQFVTYPALLQVRSALMEMAKAQHILYWDLFTVMGGLNSMPAWVQADPPLAAADHIHFSARGAREVGRLLSDAFSAELNLWHQIQDSIPPSTPVAP
jgi:lysophospholipase L1-like esterase